MPRKSRTDLLRLLPNELLNGIIDGVRRDIVGNETVPGHVAGAQLRGAAKFLQEASDALASEFDGDWTYQTYEHGFVNGATFRTINTFKGGKRFTQVSTPEAGYGNVQLYLVRKPSTGALKAFMGRPTDNEINNGYEHMASKPREYVLSLKGLAQVLSTHNAEFDMRLMHVDEVSCGKEVRIRSTELDTPLKRQSVNGWLLVSDEYQCRPPYTGRIIEEDIMVGYKVEMVQNPAGVHGIKHVLTPTITFLPKTTSARTAHVPLELDDGQPGEPVNVRRTALERRKNSRVSPLSVVFGYHHAPLEAECRHARLHEEPTRWLTSLYRIPAKAAHEKPTWSNPSAGLRTRAMCALLSVEQDIVITERTANGQIVVRRCPTEAEEAERERRVALAKSGGPAAAVTRPRASAEDARDKMKPQIAELKVTYNSGRLHRRVQPWKSRQGEEDGDWVDDQYATALAEGESKDDDDTDDEDYMPKAKMKKTEPAPNVSALRQFVMISDDEDDEAPAPPPPPVGFRAKAMRVLDAVFDD